MDSKQIHDAMRRKLPVEYDGRRYAYISAFICRYNEQGKQVLSVELTEWMRPMGSPNSVTICPIGKITILDGATDAPESGEI